MRLRTLFCAGLFAVAPTQAADPSFLDGIYQHWGIDLFEPGGTKFSSNSFDITEATPIPEKEDSNTFEVNAILSLAIFGGLNLFGQVELLTKHRTEPWAAFRLSFTNERDVPTHVFYEARFITIDMVGNSDVEALLDISVLDTSGDGSASFATSFAAFEAWNFSEFDFNRFPGTGADAADLNVMAGQTLRQVDVNATIAPMFGASPLFNELNFSGNGIISPGDTFILEGFTCIVSSGGSCPVPPDLSAIVPIPTAFLLFGSALAGLGFQRRKAA